MFDKFLAKLRQGQKDAISPSDPAAAGADLTNVVTAPQWLRKLGTTSWLLVGVFLFVVGIIWLLALTNAIVMPLITAGLIAAVTSPVVGWLNRHRTPRGIAAGLVLISVVVVVVVVAVLIIGGLTSQASSIDAAVANATNKIAQQLQDVGIDPQQAKKSAQSTTTQATSSVKALLGGLVGGIKQLSSLVFFLAITALSLFFLLKDGPSIRDWGERQSGLPGPVASTITTRTVQSLRLYFAGVSAVALFNAVVVSIGALLIGVPLVGTIALVTFLGAFIPYLGAWAAGAFAVLIAFGDGGSTAAIQMTVVVLLANGLLQQMIQPIAYGAALGIHPLAVLVVTIAGGALFGGIGLVLAAPATSAITKIVADLSRARVSIEGAAPGEPATAVP